jgi:acetate kinase
MNILVINAGSSSLKYQLIDIENKFVLAKGNCERIGIDGKFTHSSFDGQKVISLINLPDHFTAFKIVINTLTIGNEAVINSINDIHAVGHRIVNGGGKFCKPVFVDEQVIKDFSEVIHFAPLHNPPALELCKACLEILGHNVPNVFVFDTAFHHAMPPEAYLFGLPYTYYEKYKIRRYGAHGISHRYVSQRVAELMNKESSALKVITCHLGNGSSISAVDCGRCIDTSMGLTPLGGIIMGTRCGDLDPSIVTFIMEKEQFSPQEMDNLLNRQSGLLGISGLSSDLRDVMNAAAEGSENSKTALNVLKYQIKKYIGAYTAAMNGVDALVFTAGIGENAYILRQLICEDMEYIGIKLDPELNKSTVGKEGDISSPEAKVKTYVIPTNEEYLIAQDTKEVVEHLNVKKAG